MNSFYMLVVLFFNVHYVEAISNKVFLAISITATGTGFIILILIIHVLLTLQRRARRKKERSEVGEDLARDLTLRESRRYFSDNKVQVDWSNWNRRSYNMRASISSSKRPSCVAIPISYTLSTVQQDDTTTITSSSTTTTVEVHNTGQERLREPIIEDVREKPDDELY